MESHNQPPKSPEELKFFCGAYSLPKEEYPEEKQRREERKEKSPKNQDAFLVGKNFYAVCDGVGGLPAGDVASITAVDNLQKALKSLPDELSLENKITRIEKIFTKVNNEIFEMGFNMGTTVSFTQVVEGADGKRKLITVNAGDSRVYVLRKNGVLEQITTDDNKHIDRELQLKFNNVKDISKLSPKERESWDRRHFVSNILGLPKDEFKPQITITDLSDDDTIIITSDGIHDNLTNEEITNIVAEPGDNNSKAKKLVEVAQERGKEGKEKNPRSKRDDMTALVISKSR